MSDDDVFPVCNQQGSAAMLQLQGEPSRIREGAERLEQPINAVHVESASDGAGQHLGDGDTQRAGNLIP